MSKEIRLALDKPNTAYKVISDKQSNNFAAIIADAICKNKKPLAEGDIDLNRHRQRNGRLYRHNVAPVASHEEEISPAFLIFLVHFIDINPLVLAKADNCGIIYTVIDMITFYKINEKPLLEG